MQSLLVARTSRAPRGSACVLIAAAFALAACSSDLTRTLTTTPDSASVASDPSLSRWSDKKTWPDGAIPAPGADVVIPEGQRVELDVSPAAIGLLTVRGELTVAPGRSDIELQAQRINVYGKITVGSATRPFLSRFTMTLTDRPGDNLGKGIVVFSGGTLDLYGEPRTMWTHLARSVETGATEIVLEESTGWRVGDRIAISSTSSDPAGAELRQVRAISGSTIQLDQPLRAPHIGVTVQAGGATVDERAEVGLLTHNIVVQGDAASEQSQIGSHVMILRGGSAHIDGVEFYRSGQWGRMARYPFHWHMAGSVPGQFARRSSVWHSYNRCMTVHGTQDALVEDNVCYDHAGHGYFIEDGNETGNTLRHNLGMLNRPGSLLPSDANPATFWITNPDNTFEGNVAAGSLANGFWISAPKHPTGPSATDAMWPMHTPLRRFDGNVSHSNSGDGISIEEDGSTFGHDFIDYRPRAGGDPNGAPVNAVISNFTSYRNKRGIWARGDHIRVVGGMLADNVYGVQIGDASLMSESAVVGTTIVGVSPTGPARGYPVLGALVYDGPVSLEGVTFINFPAGVSGALGPEPGFGGELSPRNQGTGLRFVDAQPFWVTPDLEYTGERNAMFRDLDGSVTGTRGATLIPDGGLFPAAECAKRSDWRARVCANAYAQVRFADGANVAPGVVRSDDGTSAQFGGYKPALITANVPTRHTYSLEQTALHGMYSMQTEGLEAGEWVTTSAPWTESTIRVWRYAATGSTPVPMVATRAALDASDAMAAWYDAAAHRVYVRFVGAPGGEIQIALVRQEGDRP